MAKRSNRPPVKQASTKEAKNNNSKSATNGNGKDEEKDSSTSGTAAAQKDEKKSSKTREGERNAKGASSSTASSDSHSAAAPAKAKGSSSEPKPAGGAHAENGSKASSSSSLLPNVQFQLPFQHESNTAITSQQQQQSSTTTSTTNSRPDKNKNEQEIMDSIANGLQEMVEHERGKLLKLRGELENINNPLGYQKFREEEQVKEEIIDALTAVLEARSSGTYSDKNSLEGILNTLKDDYEDTGKAIVSKALSRRRSRQKAISAIEKELKRERRSHAKRQVKLVILVAAVTYLINKMHRDVRFRERVVGSVGHVYSLWRIKVVPACHFGFRWLNQRRKAILRALGPGGALPSRNNSSVQVGEGEGEWEDHFELGERERHNRPPTTDRRSVASSTVQDPLKRRGSSRYSNHSHNGGKKKGQQQQREKAHTHRRKFSEVRRKFEDREDQEEQQQQEEEEEYHGQEPHTVAVGRRRSSEEKMKREVSKASQEETDVFFSSFNEEKEKSHSKKKLPTAFFCPITKDVMRYPVIAADGHTYEREAIKKWLNEHKTSPTTNLVLHHTHVIPNHSLKSAIEEFDFDDEK